MTKSIDNKQRQECEQILAIDEQLRTNQDDLTDIVILNEGNNYTQPDSKLKAFNFRFLPCNTNTQISVCFILLLGIVTNRMCYGLVAPFFAPMARKKGLDDVIIGSIIGVKEIVNCLACLLIGWRMKKLGYKRAFVLGLFIRGVSYLSLGLIENIPTKGIVTFVGFAAQTIGAIGDGLQDTATNTMIPLIFPKKVSTLNGLIEFADGSGELIGNSMGGIINEFLGYLEAFAIFSGFLICLTLPAILFLPTTSKTASNDNGSIEINCEVQTRELEVESMIQKQIRTDDSKEDRIEDRENDSNGALVENDVAYTSNGDATKPLVGDLDSKYSGKISQRTKCLQIITISDIWVYSGLMMLPAVCIGFLQPTMATRLKEINPNITEYEIGFSFGAGSASYLISSLAVGFISDQTGHLAMYIILGAIICGSSFFTIAPFPYFFAIRPSVALMIFGDGLLNFGTALVVIPMNDKLLQVALENGFENTIHVFGMISGVYNFNWAFGSFIGPIIGGGLTDMIGFANAATIVGLVTLFSPLIILVNNLIHKRFHFKNGEKRET